MFTNSTNCFARQKKNSRSGKGFLGCSLAVALFAVALGMPGCDDEDKTETTFEIRHFVGVEGECVNGGIRIEVLENKIVQPDKGQYICNGRNGTAGQDGRNGTNGRDGRDGGGMSTIITTSTDVGGSCANGGVRFDMGADANGNGVLDSSEITSTRYVCNGANGKDGSGATIKTSAFSGAMGGCTDGGIKVEVLVDGVVQSDQTQYVCNGSGGQSGPICTANTEVVCDASRPTILKKCNATGSAWIEQDCSVGIPEHAVASCSAGECKWACDTGYEPDGDTCVESNNCTADQKRCKDAKVEICNATGDGWNVDQDCTAETIPDHSYAICSNNACGWKCDNGYSEDNGQCVQNQTKTCASDVDCKGTNTLTCDANASKNCISLDHYESFEGLTRDKPSSYLDDSWTSPNTGITIDYVGGRVDMSEYAIDDAGLMFKKGGKLSFTVSGGVGRFDFEMKKGFTSEQNRNVAFRANGTEQTCAGLAPFNDDATHHVTCDLNLSGNVVIEIEATEDKQVVIDNLSWSDHS